MHSVRMLSSFVLKSSNWAGTEPLYSAAESRGQLRGTILAAQRTTQHGRLILVGVRARLRKRI